MKALVYHDIGDIRLEEVARPKIKNENDAIVNITLSAICGTDLHFIRGTVPSMVKGTILGHEAVGIVDEIGTQVKNFKKGDRVVIPSTVGCGYCRMCRNAFYSQCDESNPNGSSAGTSFFGGPKNSGPLNGCQAEFVRVPFAQNNLIKLPEHVTDDKAILLSDIFPTAYFGADIAGVKPGSVVAILGCGPVGQFVITSCKLMGASRIFAIDTISSRLKLAADQGAECIDFNEYDPVNFVKEATKGSMADIVIDAVGIDAISPSRGPAAEQARMLNNKFEKNVKELVPKVNSRGKNWIPGNAPFQALLWGTELVGKCGTISIIGVYPNNEQIYPIGSAMNKNLKLVMGNCPHRAYIPKLLDLVTAGIIDPTQILSHKVEITDIVKAYQEFDAREEGWIKVALRMM